MSQQGNVEPSVSGAGGPKRQVVDLELLVVATRSEMELGRPSQDAGIASENTAFPTGPNGGATWDES